MKTLYLPNKLRPELRKIWGTPIFGRKKEVFEKFKESCQRKKFKKIITVGDCCSLNLPSDVKIFDGRIGRNKIAPLQEYSFSCWNPPTSINKEAWKTLRKAMSKNGNVFIDGEEDLLVIPSVLLSRKKTAVVYGFASKGICLIEVSPEIKKSFRKLLKKFRKGKFKKIALGGTFNRLHPGHHYFLSMAKYYGKSAIIGLCSDQMVKTRKKNFRNIQSFKERKRALESYFKRIGLRSKIIEINDIYGPAVKDKETEAILLTEETFPNGRKINRIRKKNKLKELHYIILPYLLDKTEKKISNKNKGVKPS